MPLPVSFDHCVVHVSDWERCNAFYRDVLGAELIRRPNGWAYRFGAVQLNLHGPGFHPAEVARLPVEPGNSDLCFEWSGPIADAVAHLERCGVAIHAGPMERFGARGAGTSVYFRDPDGSLLEFISYRSGVGERSMTNVHDPNVLPAELPVPQDDGRRATSRPQASRRDAGGNRWRASRSVQAFRPHRRLRLSPHRGARGNRRRRGGTKSRAPAAARRNRAPSAIISRSSKRSASPASTAYRRRIPAIRARRPHASTCRSRSCRMPGLRLPAPSPSRPSRWRA